MMAGSADCDAGLEQKMQKSSEGERYNQQTDVSHQEPLEVMEVGFGNDNMLRAREGRPAWLELAHDQPVEDEQVNEVEDEKQTEGIGEQVPERAASQSCNAPKQCRSNWSPDE